MFRVGQPDNPMIFPKTANYTRALLHQNENGSLYVSHKAAGADLYRYSLNWGSSYSNWTTYKGGNSSLADQPWSGTKLQEWPDKHVIMQYWNRIAVSCNLVISLSWLLLFFELLRQHAAPHSSDLKHGSIQTTNILM